MLKNYGYTALFTGWMAMVTFLSLYPFSGDETGLDIPHLDKAVHFFCYAVAAILGCLFLRERGDGQVPGKALLIVMIALWCYGMVIEVVQEVFTARRTMEWGDVLANCAGGLTGAMISGFALSRGGQLKWRN